MRLRVVTEALTLSPRPLRSAARTMAAKGTRTKGQHILPRFLLNAFASRSKGDERYAFLFRRGRSAVETNTKNIGKEHLFYGEPDQTGVETALQVAEQQFARAHRAVINRRAIDDDTLKTLIDFIAHLAIRGGHLRHGFAGAASEFLVSIRETLSSDRTADFIQHEILANPRLLRASLRRGLVDA